MAGERLVTQPELLTCGRSSNKEQSHPLREHQGLRLLPDQGAGVPALPLGYAYSLFADGA